MTAVLAVLAGVLAVGLVAVAAALRRTTAEREAALARVAELEADLDAALRPRPAGTPAERAVRRVVRTASSTASRVRELRGQGVGGLLAASLEDLAAWASEEQAQVQHVAAADGTVTLFFSDIEGSTALNADLGDEAWVRLLAAHDAVVRGRVARYRGQVVKTAGDGFMVAFRDAEAACRAALWVQRDLERGLEPRLRRTPVRVRIGVHTGRVVARDGDYFGRNVAMAARLCDLAGGGEVLASGAVREALDDDAAVTLVEPRTVELKGLPGEAEVWRVVRA